jgi:hypothetical protein
MSAWMDVWGYRENPLPGHERYPLRTQWGYDRYQELAETMEPKAAMAQASREESEREDASDAEDVSDDDNHEPMEESTCELCDSPVYANRLCRKCYHAEYGK